jgi:two-component system chemotaxis response regulator CheY
MKFLIVDNDTNRVRTFRTILSSLGHKAGDVESIDDGEAALNTLKRKKFNCAIVNLELPKMDGLKLLGEIRGSMALKSLPVVIFSAQSSRDNVMAAMNAGATSFIAHPCSVADVEEVLRKIEPKK